MQLPATATLDEAGALVRMAEQAVAEGAGGTPLKLDAGALHEFDTSLVAVLLHARRLALAANRPFEIAGAPDKLAQLARLYGVGELLGLATPRAPEPPTPARQGPSAPGHA